jgi:hypothetical protein
MKFQVGDWIYFTKSPKEVGSPYDSPPFLDAKKIILIEEGSGYPIRVDGFSLVEGECSLTKPKRPKPKVPKQLKSWIMETSNGKAYAGPI